MSMLKRFHKGIALPVGIEVSGWEAHETMRNGGRIAILALLRRQKMTRGLLDLPPDYFAVP
jgi:hypothetical protein